MPLNLEEFYKKYGLDDFEREVDVDRKELYEDFKDILKNIWNFIDLITRANSKWTGELLLSAALLQDEKYPPVKNQIAECMDKKPSHLKTSYRHIKENGYIKIEKDGRRKRVSLNTEDFPEFEIIIELAKDYWKCRKTRINRLKKWREEP